MEDHLGYGKSQRSDNDDYRNGYKKKKVNSSYGSMEITVPQDRKSTFEPQVVKKRQKDISDIDQKIISMYAKGMTTRQISETLDDIYGFEASEGFISDVTDKISNYRLFFTHSMGGVIYILCASLYMHFLIYKLFLS